MMTLSESFPLGSHVCYYQKTPPENYVGKVINVQKDKMTVVTPEGKEKEITKAESEDLVESHDPTAKHLSAGLPIDPEVWDSHHYAIYDRRQLTALQSKEDAARGELAEILQCPAVWSHIIPRVKALKELTNPNEETYAQTLARILSAKDPDEIPKTPPTPAS